MQQDTAEEIREAMSRVMDGGEGLSTVAQAVASISYSLAHHAAWTDERFGAVEARLGGLETGHLLILNEMGKMSAEMGKMSAAIGDMSSEMGGMRSEMGAVAVKLDRIDLTARK